MKKLLPYSLLLLISFGKTMAQDANLPAKALAVYTEKAQLYFDKLNDSIFNSESSSANSESKISLKISTQERDRAALIAVNYQVKAALKSSSNWNKASLNRLIASKFKEEITNLPNDFYLQAKKEVEAL